MTTTRPHRRHRAAGAANGPTRTAAGAPRPSTDRTVATARAARPSTSCAAARGFGEMLITAGVVILLFCVYQLFYSNLDAARAQGSVSAQLEKRWAAQGSGGSDRHTGKPVAQRIPLGDGFARIRIPRLGSDWVKPVIEGVRPQDLARGVGHYPMTAGPGGVGNFAVAGHRATHGEPFRSLDRMRKGDAVVIETGDTWYVYTVDRTEIVLPTQVGVLDPVPNRPGVKPTKRLITLSTCNPRWASYQRLIVYGHLTDTRKKSAGPPDALGRA